MTASLPWPPAADGERAQDTGSTNAAALLREATAALEAAGVDSPSWDAERLLRHVLAWDRATLVTRPQAEVVPEKAERFRALVRQRSARVPLQHLTGTQAFWKHDFLVTRDVLIPRPETELLVEMSLALVARRPSTRDRRRGHRVRLHRALARLRATDGRVARHRDLRPRPRRRARERAPARHGGPRPLPPRRPARARLLPRRQGRPRGEQSSLRRPDETATASLPRSGTTSPRRLSSPREPPPAVYERLARGAAAVLRVGGRLLVEIGLGQEAAVSSALERAGLAVVETHADLRGIARVTVAVRER